MNWAPPEGRAARERMRGVVLKPLEQLEEEGTDTGKCNEHETELRLLVIVESRGNDTTAAS